MNRFALLPLFLMAAIAALSQNTVTTRPTPDWVLAEDYPVNPKDTVGAGGSYYLLTEWQEHAERQESFYRLAVKVLSPRGLSAASFIQVNFDASYQRLYFHKLIIRRGGRDINILPTAKFEMLRREENMDRQVYDKSLDATLNIEDVQVGDIIEYSYSLSGYNPVFGGKVIEEVRLNYGVPVGKNLDRLVFSSSRNLAYKLFNKAGEPRKDLMGPLTSYLWVSENVPAVNVEDNIPAWYRIYDVAELSEFVTWGAVSAWALPLYTQTPGDQKIIHDKVEEIKSSQLTLEGRVQAAIRFVQDEIRYLSFSDGIQGYKPHDPSAVLKQRFGDCKDKSLLLATMLRQIGVQADPALVHSSEGKLLGESIPSPYAFDHCITRFVYNDTTYWTDPTVSLKRGSFKKSRSANYVKALIIAPGTLDLTDMLMPDERSSVNVHETYSFNVVGGSAQLTVKSVYSGDQANMLRSYYKSNDKEEIKRSYTNFYANEYPEVSMIDYVQYVDNDKDNIIETTEHYQIENFWTKDSLTGTFTTEFYARGIAQYISQPSTKVRKMPFAQSHPVTIIQNITIEVPEEWSVKKATSELSSPAFRFASETDYFDKKIFLRYTWESRKDHVAATESIKHVKDCDRALNALTYQLTYTPGDENATTAFNTPFLLIGIFALPLIVFGLVWLNKYNPRSRDYEVSYEGFGGWLVLPVIGIFLTPLWTIIQLIQSGYFNHLHWQILVDPAHSSYNPRLGALVLIEYLYNVILIAYSVFVLILMLKKRTSFPLFAAVMYGANVVFVFFDAIWLHSMGLTTAFDGDDSTAAIRTILTAVIWIPYITFSDRVKGTFTERKE